MDSIKSAAPDIQPVGIIVDYEIGFVKEFMKCFPDSEIDGCIYSSQCIYRQVAENGLTRRYREEVNFCITIKMLFLLAFSPVKAVVRRFEALIVSHYSISNYDDLKSIIDYFELKWIGEKQRSGRHRDRLFHLEMWNVYIPKHSKNIASIISLWRLKLLITVDAGVIALNVKNFCPFLIILAIIIKFNHIKKRS